MGSIFFEITIIICLAAILAVFFRLLKQPPILAYILTGMLIGPFAIIHIHNLDVLKNFSEFGITLLLFLLGLELKLSELKSIGKIAVISGIAQIVLTSVFTFFVAQLFHFNPISSFYISIALTFSSTIIVVKLLADKKDLRSLYGKISVGFLLVQDFFAILFLIMLSGYKPVTDPVLILQQFLIIFLKAVIVVTIMVNLSRSVLPKLIHIIARSHEILFLFSIAWVFGVAAVVSSPLIGFSIEIGGFLAGIALANATENFQIIAKIRPLRDFFVTIFFVFLGMEMAIGNIAHIIIPAILLSLFVLVTKPLIVMLIMGAMAYKKRTSFLTSISIAQISEFSLIIIVLGNKLGHISQDVVSLVTLVAIITFTTSTYLIINSSFLYKYIGRHLTIFEWRKGKQEHVGTEEAFADHIILVGATRMGATILDALEDTEEQIVVVDFDPDVVKELHEKGVKTIFGDIIDPD
ncbi:MAG: cation:proton antiporter, partial [Candidatus Levyibacteriota bacterium]